MCLNGLLFCGTTKPSGFWLSFSRRINTFPVDSNLWKKLEAAGIWEKLPLEDIRRITLWLDCNSNFYGAYKNTEAQAQGKVVLPEDGIPVWTDAATLVH